MTESYVPGTRFSRRRALQIAGAVGLTAAATGCVDTSGAPDPGAGNQSGAGAFDIPDWPDAPAEEANLRWVDSGDQKANYWEAFFAAYREQFGNVTVDYEGANWNTIQESITLGLRNGTAPDVFQLPSTITPAVAVREGYVLPWDDHLPQMAEIRDKLPTGMTATGVTDFDGKTYSLPISQPGFTPLLLINNKLAEQSDIDTGEQFTLDSFGAAVRKATKAGDGDFYGVIEHLAQDNGMTSPVNMIAQLSGLHGTVENNGLGSLNWKTGEFNYTDPLVIEVIDWYLGLQKDGIFVPGSVSLDAPGARERFPQDQAVFIFQGPWNIGLWGISNPGFDLGVSLAPVMDPADTGYVTRGPGPGNGYFLAHNCSSPDVVGNMMQYLYTGDGQRHWDSYCGSGDPAAMGETGAAKNPQHAQVYDYFDSYSRIGPSPTVRNPDTVEATQAMVPPAPSFYDVCVALFTGQATDVGKELTALSDRANRALDQAIDAARKKGADVGREDWVFSDWVYGEPYEKLYR